MTTRTNLPFSSPRLGPVRRHGAPALGARQSRGRYRLAGAMLAYGAIAGVVFSILTFDALAGAIVFFSFALIGLSWREDMMPVLPAVLTFQAMSISAGYLFYLGYGHFPGGGDASAIAAAVLGSFLALFGLLIGFRGGVSAFRRTMSASLMAPAVNYSIERLFFLTAALFSIYFVVDVLPQSWWFGAAQLLKSALALRFVAYFMLLLVCFGRREGYSYAAAATAIVILPELLTGFSGFKEILLIVLIAAAMHWRPWVRTRRQSAINRWTFGVGLMVATLLLGIGLLWTGGLKTAWRDVIWREDLASAPIERMTDFFEVAGASIGTFDFDDSVELLAARFSSGTLYFSYVIERVPEVIPHRDGELFNRAISNATTPRILFPDKPVLGGDSWLVREFAGIEVAGDESGASIGLGYPAEFYIDFGYGGIAMLSIFYGFAAAACVALLSRVVRNREILFALMAGLLTETMMAIDGSFIKLFAGMLQRTIVAAVILFLVRRAFIGLVAEPRAPAHLRAAAEAHQVAQPHSPAAGRANERSPC